MKKLNNLKLDLLKSINISKKVRRLLYFFSLLPLGTIFIYSLLENKKLENNYSQIIYIKELPLENLETVNITNSSKININTASLIQLIELPGIGEATAKLIIENRPYTRLEELLDVRGIGVAKFALINNLIVIE